MLPNVVLVWMDIMLMPTKPVRPALVIAISVPFLLEPINVKMILATMDFIMILLHFYVSPALKLMPLDALGLMQLI
jgi:hypothetical protein